MEKYVFMAGCLLIAASIAAAFLLRRYFVRYTTSLVYCLDEMISGKRDIVFDEENELLMSKVQVKLRQLYEILQNSRNRSNRDKKVLEGIVSDISHQVKTPIANIRMYQSILQNREMPETRRQEFLQSIGNQTEKLDYLMQSMIEMSKMETGMIKVMPWYQKVYPLIEQAVCDAAPKAEKKEIAIQVFCDEWIKARYDTKWTIEALDNILDNAVKYTGCRGTIKISAFVTDFFVKIEVKDNGRGIREENLTKIFKRFYREEEVSNEEGVGIGLYLAQEIAQQQKGYIGVKSEEGMGSAFSLYLPVI